MDLNDRVWSTLEGGYHIPYNASRALKRLQDTSDSSESASILDELWENLHHQGDVGLASYLAIPVLIDIMTVRRSFDWKFVSLVVLIENCRLNENNPELPPEYDDYYLGALARFEQYLLSNFKNLADRESLKSALAFFATVNGQPDLGRVIEFLDDDEIEEFINERL